MEAGALRHKVIIQQPAEVTNSLGEITVSWSTFAIVWAEILPLSGREYWSSKQVNSEVTGKIRIRYKSGITPKMRVKYGTRIFNIEAVMNYQEKNIETVLLVKEVL
jgi:SPP1 family predicted phage head-tail adaptor